MTLRESFDEAPELYDRVRPGYPDDLFADLAELAGLQHGCRVLELGCGTGQATAPLARRGYEVTALELGPRLAQVARRKLATFPSVCVVNAAFEKWPLPAEPFDLVVAATSFHWLDPAVRIAKPASALRPGGALAVISTHHVSDGRTRRESLSGAPASSPWSQPHATGAPNTATHSPTGSVPRQPTDCEPSGLAPNSSSALAERWI